MLPCHDSSPPATSSCRWYPLGRCRHPETCHFAHCREELRFGPTTFELIHSLPVALLYCRPEPDLYRTSMCVAQLQVK